MKEGYALELPILNFVDTKESEDAIVSTWNEFRDALSNDEFQYDEIDKALNYVFMKQLNDFFEINECKELYTKELRDIFISRNEVLRGTKLKSSENPDFDRFLPKSEYITEDNRFSPEKVEWLYLAIGNIKDGKNIAKNCSIKECKAEVNQRFGICHFKINQKYSRSKLVDLTIGCKYDWKQLQQGFERDSEKVIKKTLT